MFDPRDIGEDSRQPARQKPAPDHFTRAPLDERTKAEHEKEREWQRAKSKIYRDIRGKRERQGHRREYDPFTKRERIKDRTDRAVADVGIYRSVAYRDVAEAHFDGHPYAARRAVDHAIRKGDMQEHTVDGPKGGTFKVLTLTEQGARRAERIAQQQGLDTGQRAWSGMVKTRELRHDVAVFRAARIEQVKLLEQGATLKRVRIDAELKQQVARAAETARARDGKEAADAAGAAMIEAQLKSNRRTMRDDPLEDQRWIDGHSPSRSASPGRGADRLPTALCRDDPFRLLDTHRMVRRLGTGHGDDVDLRHGPRLGPCR